MDNLALLCHRHHTQIHAQPDQRAGELISDGWQMLMRDGLPWFRPPERLDRPRGLQRNTFHQAVDATRRTGRRWNATMTPQEPDPP